MAENKPGAGASTGYDHRMDRGASRPPTGRRDPRADPDDDEPPERVDVVTVERPPPSERSSPADALTNAALTLRKELAKLHQQAAAVERTIEDQRRERSDALERVEYANSRSEELEHKLEQAETEVGNVRRLYDAALEDLQNVRAERDDLARAIENAKSAAEDLARARSEVETLREAHDEALRAASTYEAELAEVRKREQAGSQKVSDSEAELQSLRERVDRTTAELTQAREEAAQVKAEAVRVRQEAAAAAEAAAKRHSEAEHERAASKEQIERLERALAEARVAQEKLAVAEVDRAAARVEAAEARTEITRLERDVEAARHARDVSLERATMAERETDGVRKDAERMQRELEAALIATSLATTRAAAAERARSSVEDSVRQLRDEVTTAFSRWRSVSPSVAPPVDGSVAPPTHAVPASMAQHEVSEAPPATKRGSTSFPPLTAEARPLSMPAPPPSPLPAPPLDDDWPPVSKPPPALTSSLPPAIPALPEIDDEEPPSLASPSSRSVAPPLPPRLRPPPLPPPARRQSIPPAVYPSVPPAGSTTPTAPPPPTPPPARPPEESPSGVHILSKKRDDLFEQLADSDTARAAAIELREHPDWLKGRPPVELLMALTSLDYDVEAPIFELARAWEREPIARALIAALRDEPDPKLREHGAWLLKHLGSPSSWPALAELASNEAEPVVVRRWLLEAIERLVANRIIGWKEVGDLIAIMVRHPDSSLRDGIIGVVAALDRSDEKRRLLLELLRTDEDEIVLSSAVHALTSALPINLDPAVTERLLGHPSPRVQRSVVDFIERSKRAAKNA